MLCGLLGRTLGHSYSPQIHAQLGTYDYQLFEKEPEDVATFLRSGEFIGLNVTIPYKKAVIAFCDELTPIAKRLGAVNTIVRRQDGTLLGHNTDYFGFKSMVTRSGLLVAGKKVLVLGSGGASNTAVAVLEDLGASVIVISRSGSDNYCNLYLHQDAAVIVNATPVGMYPNTGASPVDLHVFSKLEGVLDLIYNPAHTALLQAAEKRNIIAENGLWMLVAQAKESAEYFTGEKISDNLIQEIYQNLKFQMENIILIGMPGSGKSTIGKMIAELLSRPFCDLDKEIVKHAGHSIPDIFEAQGEEGFRKFETEVISNICKKSGLVIATGGGCVTKERNYPLLHQNGAIIWIKRDLDELPTEGRPLSQANKLSEMYAIRKPLYKAFSDISVNNNCDLAEITNCVIQAVKEEHDK